MLCEAVVDDSDLRHIACLKCAGKEPGFKKKVEPKEIDEK